MIEQHQKAMRRAVILAERPTRTRDTTVVLFASRLVVPDVPSPAAPLEDAVRHVRVRGKKQTVLVRPPLEGAQADYIGRNVLVVNL